METEEGSDGGAEVLDFKRRAGTTFSSKTERSQGSRCVVKTSARPQEGFPLSPAANGRQPFRYWASRFCNPAKARRGRFAGSSEFSRGVLTAHWQPWSLAAQPS
jgi:hypothetical protein